MAEKFGSFLRARREEKEIGLREMAKMIGVSPTCLSKVERDEFQPPVEEKVRAIATIIGCDADELLALAGRVSSDLSEIIKRRPVAEIRPPAVVCRSSQAKERVEWQADLHASCLLMPRNQVMVAWDDPFPDHKARVSKPPTPIDHPFVEIPRFKFRIGGIPWTEPDSDSNGSAVCSPPAACPGAPRGDDGRSARLSTQDAVARRDDACRDGAAGAA